MAEETPQAGDEPVEHDGFLTRAFGRVGYRPIEVVNGGSIPEVLGDVPADYRPGGYRGGELFTREDFPGLWKVIDRGLAVHEARERVRAYVEGVAGFYGDEQPDDVIDTGDPYDPNTQLLLSDLRTLVGLDNEPMED